MMDSCVKDNRCLIDEVGRLKGIRILSECGPAIGVANAGFAPGTFGLQFAVDLSSGGWESLGMLAKTVSRLGDNRIRIAVGEGQCGHAVLFGLYGLPGSSASQLADAISSSRFGWTDADIALFAPLMDKGATSPWDRSRGSVYQN